MMESTAGSRSNDPGSGAKRAPCRVATLLCYLLLLAGNSGCISQYLFRERPEVIADAPMPEIDATIVIADNQVYENNRSGIRVRGSSPVAIKDCEISRNGRAGLLIEDRAEAEITGNNFNSNNMAGIAANNTMVLDIRNNLIHQNMEGGIRFRNNAVPEKPMRIRLEYNRIFRNLQGGIHAVSSSPVPVELFFARNEVIHNGQTGIRIENNVHMAALRNRIEYNEAAGLAAYISEDIPPLFDIYQNRIAFNLGAGIFVHSGITGRIGISDNLIYNNFRAGVATGLWGETGSDRIDLQIFHNTVVANGSEVEGSGIRNDSWWNAVRIENNILAYNFTSGLMSRSCGGASTNLLFANGETSTIKDIERDLMFLSERLQYAGCTNNPWRDILAPPKFTAPDRYDFSLRQGSPAKNAAVPLDGEYFQKIPHPDLGAQLMLFPWTDPEEPPDAK